jgi:hypothetical protein
MIYFACKDIVLRTATTEDVLDIKDRLRASDVEEIDAALGEAPGKPLETSFRISPICLTLVYRDRPTAICGVVPESFLGSKAVVWMLGTDDIRKIQKTFIRLSNECIKFFLGMYPYLYNFVYDGNAESKRWLERCGAEFSVPIPWGAKGLPFRYFALRRK